MFADSDAKEAAWKFIEFAYKDEFRETFDLGEGFLPVTKNVAALEHFTTDPDVAGFAAGLPYAKFAPVIANWEEIADVTVRTMQQIYLGEVTPEDGLAAAAAEINKIRGL
jgi:multiple sugar transport system substrate-binding protein